MKVLRVRNVHQALPFAVLELNGHGARRDSRAGEVLVSKCPVTTVYERPSEKVIFWEERDANPFFHLFEALWMLAGREDVAWLARFNSNIAKVASDDGKTYHGAYGRRWRWHWKIDQLVEIASGLMANPDCRRQVLQTWSVTDDLSNHMTKDVPCNMIMTFQVGHDDRLDLSVFCRSNDIVWGCYGSDAVTFGMLLEYVAAMIGREVGTYYQVSVNWHGYVDTLARVSDLMWKTGEPSPYETGAVLPFPLVSGDIGTWHQDLKMFMDEGTRAIGYRDPFFRKVAIPMLRAWEIFKGAEAPARYDDGIKLLAKLDHDWAMAGEQWLNRRAAKWASKQR
jgi:thymidylate synthase